MSEMIERVARALIADTGMSWDRLLETTRRMALRQAKIAIEAMREPTDAMQDAGCMDDGRGGDTGAYLATKIYRAMIEAALASDEPETGVK